jgi:ATP-dependent DNA helicase Q4
VRGLNAESYHAGKSPEERALIQRKFMEGRLRIIVATVAFGMGINKQDVRSVIHFSLPKSLENYIQVCTSFSRILCLALI